MYMNAVNKLSLPAAILVASIIFGGFYYASQVNKSNSIEKQQQIELQSKVEADKANKEAEQQKRGVETIIYTNPAKETNQLKLETCINEAEKEYNRIVLDLSAKVKNGELDSSYFGPSVDAMIKRKSEQKADCVAKYN